MKIYEIMIETASAGGSSAGAIAVVANPKSKKNTNQKKNKNRTAKNALDSKDNLMGGAVVKR